MDEIEIEELEDSAYSGDLNAARQLYDYYQQIGDQESMDYWHGFLPVEDEDDNLEQEYIDEDINDDYDDDNSLYAIMEEANKPDIYAQFLEYKSNNISKDDSKNIFAGLLDFENKPTETIAQYKNIIDIVEQNDEGNKTEIIVYLHKQLANLCYDLYHAENKNIYKTQALKSYLNLLELTDKDSSEFSLYKQRCEELSKDVTITKWYQEYKDGKYTNASMLAIAQMRDEGNIFADLIEAQTYFSEDTAKIKNTYNQTIDIISNSIDENKSKIVYEMLAKQLDEFDRTAEGYLSIYQPDRTYRRYKEKALKVYGYILDDLKKSYTNGELDKETYKQEQIKYIDKVLSVYELSNDISDSKQRSYFLKYHELKNDFNSLYRYVSYYCQCDDKSSETILVLQQLLNDNELKKHPTSNDWLHYILACWNIPDANGNTYNLTDTALKLAQTVNIFTIFNLFGHDKYNEPHDYQFYDDLPFKQGNCEKTFWRTLLKYCKDNSSFLTDCKETYQLLQNLVSRYICKFQPKENGKILYYSWQWDAELKDNYKLLYDSINTCVDRLSFNEQYYPNEYTGKLIYSALFNWDLYNLNNTNKYNENGMTSQTFFNKYGVLQNKFNFDYKAIELTSYQLRPLKTYVENNIVSLFNGSYVQTDIIIFAKGILLNSIENLNLETQNGYSTYIEESFNIGWNYNNGNRDKDQIGWDIADLIANKMPSDFYYENRQLLTTLIKFVTKKQYKKIFKGRTDDYARLGQPFSTYAREITKEDEKPNKAGSELTFLLSFGGLFMTARTVMTAIELRKNLESIINQKLSWTNTTNNLVMVLKYNYHDNLESIIKLSLIAIGLFLVAQLFYSFKVSRKKPYWWGLWSFFGLIAVIVIVIFTVRYISYAHLLSSTYGIKLIR